MTLRVMFVLIVSVLAVPFAVFLRPAYSAELPDPCTAIPKAQRSIAVARDSGATAEELVYRFRSMVDEGKISAEMHGYILEWVILIYSTDLTPDEVYAQARKACMKELGRTEA